MEKRATFIISYESWLGGDDVKNALNLNHRRCRRRNVYVQYRWYTTHSDFLSYIIVWLYLIYFVIRKCSIWGTFSVLYQTWACPLLPLLQTFWDSVFFPWRHFPIRKKKTLHFVLVFFSVRVPRNRDTKMFASRWLCKDKINEKSCKTLLIIILYLPRSKPYSLKQDANNEK